MKMVKYLKHQVKIGAFSSSFLNCIAMENFQKDIKSQTINNNTINNINNNNNNNNINNLDNNQNFLSNYNCVIEDSLPKYLNFCLKTVS